MTTVEGAGSDMRTPRGGICSTKVPARKRKESSRGREKEKGENSTMPTSQLER